MARLDVDCRERGLIRQLAAKHVPCRVLSLPVGGVLCKYSDSSSASWILERKRADDLACSIKDGRMREQTSRLFSTGLRVFFVIEGDLRWLDGMYDSMMGAMLNANLKNSRCFRTWDLEETACLISHLVKKLERCPAPVVSATGLRPPHRSKRQRAEEADNVFVRQLMCVPSVSEGIAVALLERFGNLEALQDALRDARTFPKVKICQKRFLGKARISKLARYLLRTGGGA